MLRDTPDYKLRIDAVDDIAFSLNISKEKVETVINNYDLFTIDDMQFFSERLIRNMEKYSESKKRLSEAGKAGMAKRYKEKPFKLVQ